MSGVAEERPCPTCGRWPDEDHIAAMHDAQAKLEQEANIQLAYLEGLASGTINADLEKLQLAQQRKQFNVNEFFDKWRDELEAGL